MTDPARCVWIGLGSNQSWPVRQILRAASRLSLLESVESHQLSSLYRSAAWGGLQQPDYINAVMLLVGRLEPDMLFDQMLGIEQAAGRVRSEQQWAARPLDLDLLLCDQRLIRTAALTVPHPRLHERDFVLRPLAECWPDLQVPDQGSVTALLQRCPDDSPAARLNPGQINVLRQMRSISPDFVA